jgi:hypothetical protein
MYFQAHKLIMKKIEQIEYILYEMCKICRYNLNFISQSVVIMSQGIDSVG